MENQPDFHREALRMIKQKMEEKGWNQTKLAGFLHVYPSAVFQMLNGSTMSLNKLKELSDIFEYNFFTDLAGMLDLPEPAKEPIPPVDHSACQERIRELEIENRTLLMILGKDRNG